MKRSVCVLAVFLSGCQAKLDLQSQPVEWEHSAIDLPASVHDLACSMVVGPRHVQIWFKAEAESASGVQCRNPFAGGAK